MERISVFPPPQLMHHFTTPQSTLEPSRSLQRVGTQPTLVVLVSSSGHVDTGSSAKGFVVHCFPRSISEPRKLTRRA
jgi:hypothetical protein